MEKNFNINADFKNSGGKFNVKVVLLCSKEEDYYITYSPHLEVSGYGKTKSDSIESFNICLKEFLDYTVNKKTLHKELIRMGWELKKVSEKRPKKVVAPTWENLLARRKGYDISDTAATQDDDKIYIVDVVALRDEDRTYTETSLLQHTVDGMTLTLTNDSKSYLPCS